MGRDSLSAQLAAAGVLPTGGSATLAVMQLDPVPLAPGLARRFVQANLSHVSSSQRDAALLLTSELVTGVVLHARTSLEIGVGTVEGDVVLAVTDHDLAEPGAAVPSLRGRSKALVAALADEHGAVSEHRCRMFWAVLRVHGRASSAGTLEAATARS
jgi:hypothetical protein